MRRWIVGFSRQAQQRDDLLTELNSKFFTQEVGGRKVYDAKRLFEGEKMTRQKRNDFGEWNNENLKKKERFFHLI